MHERAPAVRFCSRGLALHILERFWANAIILVELDLINVELCSTSIHWRHPTFDLWPLDYTLGGGWCFERFRNQGYNFKSAIRVEYCCYPLPDHSARAKYYLVL
jgi:hypothetical protein